MFSNKVSTTARMFTLAALFASAALVSHADEKNLTATLFNPGGIHAAADSIFYDNVSTFTGSAYSNGGATAAAPITTLVADDISLLGSQPVSVSSFFFSVANLNPTAVSARPRIRMYLGDAAGSLPGTLVYAASFNPISFTAFSANFYGATSSFVVPANTILWAGITFDNVGGTATVAQLNNLGQGLYNPPTVGSSQDVFFQTTTAGSFNQNTPPGSLFNLGANPVANFGWRFVGSAVTPEPGAVAMLMGFGVSGAALLRRRRAARK